MKETQGQSTEVRNSQLREQISRAQTCLYDKLIDLDIRSSKISPYNQRYLGDKLANLERMLELYGNLLYLSLCNNHIAPKDFVLVDYGGGSGLISLLAVEVGIGTVIYNDIYDVSCKDVEYLSHALGMAVNHVVCGDVDVLVSYLQKNSISINAITSYDVLEHIYDVEAHFEKLSHLNDSFQIVYASGANIANPRYVHSVRKAQIEAEYKTRDKKWGHKERDTLRSFLDVRREIISTYAPDLTPELVDQLAGATRGLIQHDIEKCVDEFRLQGSITYHIEHPTNTCDPYTGNWCEHLMDFEWLAQAIKNADFSVEIAAGYYETCGSPLRKSIKVLLNAAIRLLGAKGICLAPYYVVHAVSSGKRSE